MFADHISRNAFDVRLKGRGNFSAYLDTIPDVDWYHLQETSGSVAYATNSALASGRRLNTQTYAAYTAGAGWSNSAAQLALHTAGSVATLAHAGILATGKTYEVVTIISGRTAGSVILTGTGAVSMTADNTYTDNITALGTALTYTPSTDFDGKIDCATVTVKQTNILASTAYPGAEELDESGASGTATAANWTKGNNADATNPSIGELKVARDGTNTPFVHQIGSVIVGVRYVIEAKVSSDGNATPIISQSSAVTITSGTTSTDLQTLSAEAVATGTSFLFITSTSTGTEFVTWSEITVKPANPMNGDNTAAAVGQPGAGNIPYVYTSDAATSFVNVYSTELNGKINFANGGLMIVGQSDDWTAGIDVLARLAVGADDEIVIYRSGSDLICTYKEGANSSTVTIPSGSPSGLFTVDMDWDVAGVGMRAFYDGSQSGGNQAIAAAIIGNLDPTLCCIFANVTTPANVWDGDGAHLGIAYRTPTVAEHGDFYSRSGI